MVAVAATHGTLGLGSPWTRALFPGDARRETEALIPVGFQINVTAMNGKPGPWRVIAYRVTGDGGLVEVLRWVRWRPQEAVQAMAQQLQEQAATVGL